MRRLLGILLLLLLASVVHAGGTLDIYFVDVEGGQATLIVAPSGQSMLVDAGWPGFEGRDADRIVAAAKLAGVRQIDYLLVTHYHTDHVGGVPQLAERIPIMHFLDHGPNTESGRRAEELSAAYAEARARGKHVVVKPGDSIPLKGTDVKVLCARGELINSPLKGAGKSNSLCHSESLRAEDTSENARSVGFLLTFGKFRFIDLADITWNKELGLACPVNLIGTVDVYLVTHHGMNLSGPPALVHALRPRVAIMNNGAKKGGAPEALRVVRSSPGLEDLWQLHFALAGGKDSNSPEQYIANLDENCQGHWLRLSAREDGSFTVTNGRTGYSKSYKAGR